MPSAAPTKPSYLAPFLRHPTARQPLLVRLLDPTTLTVQRLLQYALRFSLLTPTPHYAALLRVVQALAALRRLLALSQVPPLAQQLLSTDVVRVPLISLRAALDLLATVLDFGYLLARRRIVPLSSPRLNLLDRSADLATLAAAGLGLVQVSHEVSDIWKEGRTVRKEMLELEDKIEALEFWDEQPPVLPTPSVSKGVDAGYITISDSTTLDGAAIAQEGKYRERVRLARRRLKHLRRELNALWLERIGLVADMVFVGSGLVPTGRGGIERVRAGAGVLGAGVGCVPRHQRRGRY